MCLGENIAPFYVHYLNAQLTVLYQNARRCLDEHPHANHEDNRPFSLLASFAANDASRQSQAILKAPFKAPELEFVCNHNVVLKLTVESIRGTNGLSHDSLYVCYLVPILTETREMISPGHFGDSVKFDVLNLEHAELLHILSGSDGAPATSIEDAALSQYLMKYLHALREAKINVLFSLPLSYLQARASGDAEHGRSPPLLNHALTAEASRARVTTLYGVTVDQINERLDWGKCGLAHYCLWDDHSERHIAVEFGAPRIELLCSSEVVVHFDIQRIQFLGEGADVEYRGWKLAFVMYALWAHDEDGVTARLDFPCGSHHQPFLSDIPEKDGQGVVIGASQQQHVISVIQSYYMSFLKENGFDVLYSRDKRWERTKDTDPTGVEHPLGIWTDPELEEDHRDALRRTTVGPFDQVVAISQESLNAHFAGLFERAGSILQEWKYPGLFKTTFKRQQIRLLSNNRAILWVHLERGAFVSFESIELPVLENANVEIPQGHGCFVSNSYLAFEVNIVARFHEELTGALSNVFQSFPAVIEHGGKQDRQLKHILLDLEGAQYLPKYSKTHIRGEIDGGVGGPAHALQCLVVYIQRAYFSALGRYGLNVIASVPIWDKLTTTPSSAITDMGFRIQCDIELTRDNWSLFAPSPTSQPVLVIFGVSGSKDLPVAEFPSSVSWIPRLRDPLLGFSHGTVAVAKHAFIERAVLAPLSRVNALTTLIPVRDDILPGMVSLSLRSWAEIESQSARKIPTVWAPQESDESDFLKFVWEHAAEHIYRCESSYDQFMRYDRIACRTENRLSISTAVGQGSPRIQIDGTVELTMVSADTPKPIAACASIKWGFTFTVDVVSGVIRISPAGATSPVCTLESSSASAPTDDIKRDPRQPLEGAFRFPEDINPALNETELGTWQFVYSAGGAYHLGTPAFNNNGDLVLELLREGPPPAATAPNRRRCPGEVRQSVHRRRRSSGRLPRL